MYVCVCVKGRGAFLPLCVCVHMCEGERGISPYVCVCVCEEKGAFLCMCMCWGWGHFFVCVLGVGAWMKGLCLNVQVCRTFCCIVSTILSSKQVLFYAYRTGDIHVVVLCVVINTSALCAC